MTSLADITIRTHLLPGDLSYVGYMHGRLYHQEYQYSLSFEKYVLAGLHEFLVNYSPSNQRVWVCKHQNRIVGFMLLMNRGDAAQLRYFLIDPGYRGIGLGKKLMELFMNFLRESGYRKAFLLTTSELPTAAALYLRAGFKLTSEQPSNAFGKDVVEQRYDLSL